MAPQVPEAPEGWSPRGPTPVHPGEWSARAGEFWVRYARRGDPGLAVLVRFERDAAGRASPTAVLLEHTDGRALAVRDVKNLRLGEVMNTAVGDALVPWMGGELGQRLVQPAHDGPRRLPDAHHGRVLALLEEALVRAAGRHVVWMRQVWSERYGRQVPDPTMRRWIAAAKEHERAGRDRLAAEFAEHQRARVWAGEQEEKGP